MPSALVLEVRGRGGSRHRNREFIAERLGDRPGGVGSNRAAIENDDGILGEGDGVLGQILWLQVSLFALFGRPGLLFRTGRNGTAEIGASRPAMREEMQLGDGRC